MSHLQLVASLINRHNPYPFWFRRNAEESFGEFTFQVEVRDGQLFFMVEQDSTYRFHRTGSEEGYLDYTTMNGSWVFKENLEYVLNNLNQHYKFEKAHLETDVEGGHLYTYSYENKKVEPTY